MSAECLQVRGRAVWGLAQNTEPSKRQTPFGARIKKDIDMGNNTGITKETINVNDELKRVLSENIKNKKLLKKDPSLMFTLATDHQLYAMLLLKKHQLSKYLKKREEKKCSKCNGNGVHSVNPNGTINICVRCVNTKNVIVEWKIYCSHFPDLALQYGNLK